MPKKGENIFKRKDGRWEARYIRGREPSGGIRYGFCYGRTYREAKEKAAVCKAALLSGAAVPTFDRRRFAAFCQEWLQSQRGSVKESTYVKYGTVLRKHILPSLGACYPRELSTRLAEDFKQSLLSSGLSVKTVRDVLVILRSVLTFTSKRCPGLIPKVEIDYPKENRREMRVLSGEEQRRLTEYLERDMDTCRFGVLLALITGIRLGELCALKWENISLESATIRVEATMQRLQDSEGRGPQKTRVVISSPKSGTSLRTIPLTAAAAALCARFDPHCPRAYVLTGSEKYMEPRQVQKKLARFTRECGLEGVHFHTLRHTFATRCVEVGFELKSLSEILGHASTSITLDRYVHSTLELKRSNMEKLALLKL